MNYYTLFLRSESIDFASYSPEDMQKIMADFDEWNAITINKNQLIASGNLSGKESKVIRSASIVSDGPYSEAKEAITGFFIIAAENMKAAEDIASGCPFIPRGGSVEVRQIPQLEFEDAAGPIVQEQIRARAESVAEG